MGKRFAIVIGVAMAGVMALGAQTAAAVVEYDTKLLKITQDRYSGFHGDVKSQVGKCERERRVVAFRQRPGPDLWLHTERTGGSGSWDMALARSKVGWKVYAKVRHRVRDQFICRSDRSETYRVIV